MGKGTWKPGRHVLGSVNAKLKIPGACRCAAQTGGDESGEGERDVQLGGGGRLHASPLKLWLSVWKPEGTGEL